MTFEQVLPALKNGNSITREGQYGKSRFFYKDENAGIVECNDDSSGEWQFGSDELLADDWYVIDEHNENTLPRPVIRDGNGKLIRDYTPRDFYLKLQEEIFEVMEAEGNGKDDVFDKHFGEEIADVSTVCISQLEALGYNENVRSGLFRRVNEKNEKRGYFKE